MLLCTFVFYTIGHIAKNKKEPMSFYSGIKVESSSIKDIKKYNYANSIMWKCYALWYLLTALMHSISPFVATIMLMLSCTLGLIILVYTYKQIEKKYKIETKE